MLYNNLPYNNLYATSYLGPQTETAAFTARLLRTHTRGPPPRFSNFFFGGGHHILHRMLQNFNNYSNANSLVTT